MSPQMSTYLEVEDLGVVNPSVITVGMCHFYKNEAVGGTLGVFFKRLVHTSENGPLVILWPNEHRMEYLMCS